MSMSPFAPVAFLYLLLLLIVLSTPVMLQEETQASCSPACSTPGNSNVSHVNSTTDITPSTQASLVSVSPPSRTDGGSVSTHHFAPTATPLSPETTQKPVPEPRGPTNATQTTPGPLGSVGTSSAPATSTKSGTTTTLSPQRRTSAPLANTTTLSPKTSAPTKSTPLAGSITTSASPPTLKTTSSSSVPSGLVTAPDQTSPSPTEHAARTVSTSAGPPDEPVAPVTKVAVVEVAGAALTRQLVDTASLLAIVLFGLIFFVVTVAVFVSRACESYRRKDYTQVDYLINGMYNDSGV